MTAEDQGQLERYVESGKKVRCASTCKHIFKRAGGSGECGGRDSRAREREQVLVVGGTWILDLSEGATDTDRLGERAGLAEAIVRSGNRPRRTIRFVLFTARRRARRFVCLHEATSIGDGQSWGLGAG